MGDCWKNNIKWIRNWCLICSLEDVIKSDKNPESHIGKEIDNIWVYMLMARHWVGLWHMWTRFSCPNNKNFFFLSQSVSAKQFYFEQCVCSLMYINSYSIIHENWLFGKNFLREKIIFCIHLSQRERKRHRLVRRARTQCASSSWCRSFYLGRQTSMSLKATQIVWGVKFALKRLCQTQDFIWIIHPSRIWSMSF